MVHQISHTPRADRLMRTLSALAFLLGFLPLVSQAQVSTNAAKAPSISRITLEPINLVFHAQGKPAQILLPELKWPLPTGSGGLNHFTSFGKDVDVMWGSGALLFLNDPGAADEVLADSKLQLADVVSDGRYVWASASYGRGVFMLSREGQVLATVDSQYGLPASDAGGPVLHPLAPGKILAAGSIEKEHRSWIAIIEFDGTEMNVKLFHDVTKPWPAKPDDKAEFDPGLFFKPQGFVELELPGPATKKLIYVLRGRHSPLVLDIDKNLVGVYPSHNPERTGFPRTEAPREAFANIGGQLWVAGSNQDFHTFDFNERIGLFYTVRKTPNWDLPNLNTGSLVEAGRWVYYVGESAWRRIDPRTGQEELLLNDPRLLPNYGSGNHWSLAYSTEYGLVAFSGGQLYRVTVGGSSGASLPITTAR